MRARANRGEKRERKQKREKEKEREIGRNQEGMLRSERREGERVSVGYTYVCRPRVQCIQIARKRVVPSAGRLYIGDG